MTITHHSAGWDPHQGQFPSNKNRPMDAKVSPTPYSDFCSALFSLYGD